MRFRFTAVLVCVFAFGFFPSIVRSEQQSESPAKENVWVTSIAQIGNSDQFVAGTAQGLLLRESTVMTFQPGDPSKLTELYKHPAAVWSIGCTGDGKTLASVDYRGNLVTFDVASKKATTHEKAFERWCQSLIVSPDSKSVVAGNEAGKLMVWDLAAGKVAKSVELEEHAITGLAISPDGQHLAASDGAGHVHLLKWPSLEKAGKIKVSEETVWCVAFTNDGQQLLCGSSDRNIYSCAAKADSEAKSIAKGKDWITRIAVSKSGQVAASEVGGRLHFPSLGGTDSMDAKSGVWALCWNGNDQLIAGTRKDGLVMAGRSWKWTEANKPEPPKQPEPPKTPEPPMKEEAKPEPKQPEPKKPAPAKEAVKETVKDAPKKDTKDDAAKKAEPKKAEKK